MSEPNADTIIQMMDDLIKLAAMQIVHGVEPGFRRFRYLRFGIPESDPLPRGVDLDCRSMQPWQERRRSDEAQPAP